MSLKQIYKLGQMGSTGEIVVVILSCHQMNDNPTVLDEFARLDRIIRDCEGSLALATRLKDKAARRAAAELRRKAWRLRWLDIVERHAAEGLTIRAAVTRAADDAERLAAEAPQLKSEIIRALEQFVDALVAGVARAKAQQQTTYANNPKETK